MSDPLASYRRERPNQKDGSLPPDGPSGYEAFKAVDKRQIRLSIRLATNEWNRLSYSYLLRIVDDGPFGTQICLVYSFMVVVITGRNLAAIADAIDDERCQFIQEFDVAKWEKPADTSTMLIESIYIHTQSDQDSF